MMIRSALASLLLILALAGLVAGGAQAVHPMAGGAGMAAGMSVPDCDDCPGDAGEALACPAACALTAVGDLGPMPAPVAVDVPTVALPAAVVPASPDGVAIAPDPPRPKGRSL